MPGSDRPQQPEHLIACSVCRKEIPLSAAFTPQGADYIEYFCGLECYQEFLAEQKSGESQSRASQSQESGKPSK